MTACPLCKQAIIAPTLGDVIAAHRLNGTEAKILSAAWAGRGRPVQTVAIFDVMFEDDIDGGPPMGKMYAAFYAGLRSLNSKLSGAGIAIEPVGYRDGWRVVFDLRPS
jgi:hypothetical protein